MPDPLVGCRSSPAAARPGRQPGGVSHAGGGVLGSVGQAAALGRGSGSGLTVCCRCDIDGLYLWTARDREVVLQNWSLRGESLEVSAVAYEAETERSDGVVGFSSGR